MASPKRTARRICQGAFPVVSLLAKDRLESIFLLLLLRLHECKQGVWSSLSIIHSRGPSRYASAGLPAKRQEVRTSVTSSNFFLLEVDADCLHVAVQCCALGSPV